MAGPEQDIIRVEEDFYILATSALADDRTRVLKHNETFAVFDRYGDIQPIGLGEQGLYHEGTRFLSRLELRLWNRRPQLLSSLVKSDNSVLAVDLANPDISRNGSVLIPRETIHIVRFIFVWQGACYVRIWLRNFAGKPVEIPAQIKFDADFRDIFEIRGMKRKNRGTMLSPNVTPQGICLNYKGLDDVRRRMCAEGYPHPQVVTPTELSTTFKLRPGGETNWYLSFSCSRDPDIREKKTFATAKREADANAKDLRQFSCEVEATNEHFNRWVDRSISDLYMMMSKTAHGLYPYAGIPWYSTPFGRDGIITAMEMLWNYPFVARGVLNFLAAYQADDFDPSRDSAPGKIIHELRRGEMANLGEVPFGFYYGSADSTPLFIMLAGMYYERTGDRELIEEIWPNIERALEWIRLYGDRDGDGFVEYFRETPTGLAHQGWKDSHNSIFHEDGSDATGPIALCEVQSYVYAAYIYAAKLAAAVNAKEYVGSLLNQARQFRTKFEQAFWIERLSTYALALDGDKQPCQVVTSNPGHVLFTGLANWKRAIAVGRTIMLDQNFSGWGIRTVSAAAARYNPMSYHNGSVWPHDNAIAAFGLARYGMKEAALRVFCAMFDIAQNSELYRMPELICGFSRRREEGLTSYPLACVPQAWAAGSVFMLLQACLGLDVNALRKRITFHQPTLPQTLKELEIRNLVIGDSSVDIRLIRHHSDVGVNVLKRNGEVEIVVVT